MLDGRDPSVDTPHVQPLQRVDVSLAPTTSRRGRPRGTEETIAVGMRIPVSVYDAYCRASLSERCSTRSLMRQALAGYAPVLMRRRRRR